MKYSKKESFIKKIINNKIYKFAGDTLKMEIRNLGENKRLTLPVLADILKRYESIPTVQKLLSNSLNF